MEILSNFVVLEGLDGSGTTTQLNTLEAFFQIYKTFEPTDGIIGKIIRRTLRREIEINAETLAFLFAADRNEHLYAPGGIAERCKRGELVVSDRYIPSSYVYQGLSCGRELPMQLNKNFPWPELLIFFDVDAETAEKRLAGRSGREIFEYLDFQKRARDLYLEVINELSGSGINIEVIDASLSEEEVALKVRALIQKLPIMKNK